MISNDFPQLKIGESLPIYIYILNTMESHRKKVCVLFNICQLIQESNSKHRIVSSGCFTLYYKVKKAGIITMVIKFMGFSL